LNSQHDEVELEAAVTEVFRKYGTVYVKITRDKKNMPMGFVQFTVRGSRLFPFRPLLTPIQE
jgi:hypothetical protein